MGDLNDRCLTYDSPHPDSELGTRLLDLVVTNNLFQIIDEPTHITSTSSSLLDLIITDSPGYILDSGVLAPIGDPYHSTVFCKFQIQYTTDKPYK